MQRRFLLLAFAALLAGCSSAPKPDPEKAVTKQPEPPVEAKPPVATPAATVFNVKFDTSKGPFVVEVHPEWAPKGAERFRQLVDDKFFDGARFFRVVPNFIIQFGLAGSPAMTKKWDTPIADDPVLRTNAAGTMTFATAGPGTRTSQLFINLNSNQGLDGQGFAPFGKVTSGMDVVLKLYSGYGEQPDQAAITARGNGYLTSQFPNLDYIKSTTILP